MEERTKYYMVIKSRDSDKLWLAVTTNPDGYKKNIEEGTYTIKHLQTYGYDSILETIEMNNANYLLLCTKYGQDNLLSSSTKKSIINNSNNNTSNNNNNLTNTNTKYYILVKLIGSDKLWLGTSKKPDDYVSRLKGGRCQSQIIKQYGYDSVIKIVRKTKYYYNLILKEYGKDNVISNKSRKQINNNNNTITTTTTTNNSLSNIISNNLSDEELFGVGLFEGGYTLYILRLKEDKWYVGVTDRLLEDVIREYKEFDNSNNNNHSVWIKMYDVIDCVYSRNAWSKLDVDYTTILLMFNKGIDNVRGGNYNLPNLTPIQIKQIEDIHANMK